MARRPTAKSAGSPAQPADAADAADARLRAAPSFVQALTLDGRPYVAQEAEPYRQFWLSERERQLLSLFAAPRGLTAAQAIDALAPAPSTAAVTAQPGSAAIAAPLRRQRQALARTIRAMREAGVLIDVADDTSRYDRHIVADYVAHRPFPAAIAQQIIQRAAVGPDSRVLDLAGGPGDLALALAQASSQVSLMELSRGFLAAARDRARRLGRPLQTVHDTCNRLVYHDGRHDLITVSQALHWLDDVAVCRGVARQLNAGGSFVVVHSAIELPPDHPLGYLLGHDSILGRKQPQPFADEVQALARRLALLLAGLQAPGADRLDPISGGAAAGGGGSGGGNGSGNGSGPLALKAIQLYRQPRPFGPGFARGFLTPRHIAVTGLSPQAFWDDLHARCQAATAAQRLGTQHWALLHFQRGDAADGAGGADAEVGQQVRRAVRAAGRALPLAYDGPDGY